MDSAIAGLTKTVGFMKTAIAGLTKITYFSKTNKINDYLHFTDVNTSVAFIEKQNVRELQFSVDFTPLFFISNNTHITLKYINAFLNTKNALQFFEERFY
jgi:hypothetical protein